MASFLRQQAFGMSTKGVVAVGTLALLGAIGYTNIYLPFYSETGKSRRDEYKKTGRIISPTPPSNINKGSMWTQLDRGIKGAEQGHDKPVEK